LEDLLVVLLLIITVLPVITADEFSLRHTITTTIIVFPRTTL
jgi:hypothetical protein